MSIVFAASMLSVIAVSCANAKEQAMENPGIMRSAQTLDAVYRYYATDDSCLLHENYPDDSDYRAGYLADSTGGTTGSATHRAYSFLWPFSGTLSAVSALYSATGDEKYLDMFDSKCVGGLERYFDSDRQPEAYTSYIKSAPESDRFYDDNVWIGIDMVDMYESSGRKKYLDVARRVWSFVESGIDSVQGGGIYWCEQKKFSKNTCCSAPGAVLALKLYHATGDQHFYDCGEGLYKWTKEKLQDSIDGLYFDKISLDGNIDRAKYSYNSGQMIQAASLLFKISGDSVYLNDARRVADSSMDYFFNAEASDAEGKFRLLGNRDIWFASVLLRGIAELDAIDGSDERMKIFARNLNHAYYNARDKQTGLFHSDWTGSETDERKWLLTQAAMSEMFARCAEFYKN